MDFNVSGPTVTAAGAILAAVIAGSFSYLNLVISKEQKVSEFRQQWIDSLRSSISEYLSALSYLSMLYTHYYEKPEQDRDPLEMAKGVQEIYSKANQAYNDIVLRVNSQEVYLDGRLLNESFLKALEKTRELFNAGNAIEAYKACDPVREAGKPLLKHEWNRVKSGEPRYRKAKIVAVVPLLFGVLIAIAVLTLPASSGSGATVPAATATAPDQYNIHPCLTMGNHHRPKAKVPCHGGNHSFRNWGR